jgi:hypothetical protein
MRHWGPTIDPVPIVIATILALEEVRRPRNDPSVAAGSRPRRDPVCM